LTSAVPLHPLTRLLASGLTSKITVMTNDGELPGLLLPYHNGDVERAAQQLKPVDNLTGTGVDIGYARIAADARTAIDRPEALPWSAMGKGTAMHVCALAAMVRSLKTTLERAGTLASLLSWGAGGTAALSGFAQSGADFILSDGDSWSGNIADALFGLRPVIGMNNVKLMGYELQYEADFSVGSKKVGTYFLPVDAPFSSAAAGSAQERKFLPQSAVMERQIKGVPVYTAHAPPDTDVAWAVEWYSRQMPAGVVGPYYPSEPKEPPKELAPYVSLTSWDPVVENLAGTDLGKAIKSIGLPVEAAADTVLIRGEFRMRVPAKLARATTVLVEDTELEIISRAYGQRGSVLFNDEDPALARKGDEVLTSTIRGVDDKGQVLSDLTHDTGTLQK